MGILEKTGFYLSLLLIATLLFLIFFSKNGISDFQQLREKETQVAARIEAAHKKNKRLEKEIQSLKKDIGYIKHLAKHEHDMAEPGELIFKQKPSEK